jgi:hypothetical protein
MQSLESNHWTLYLYSMKSPVTRDKYQKRLGKFFNFLGLEGATIEDKRVEYLSKWQENIAIGLSTTS